MKPSRDPQSVTLARETRQFPSKRQSRQRGLTDAIVSNQNVKVCTWKTKPEKHNNEINKQKQRTWVAKVNDLDADLIQQLQKLHAVGRRAAKEQQLIIGQWMTKHDVERL